MLLKATEGLNAQQCTVFGDLCDNESSTRDWHSWTSLSIILILLVYIGNNKFYCLQICQYYCKYRL